MVWCAQRSVSQVTVVPSSALRYEAAKKLGRQDLLANWPEFHAYSLTYMMAQHGNFYHRVELQAMRFVNTEDSAWVGEGGSTLGVPRGRCWWVVVARGGGWMGPLGGSRWGGTGRLLAARLQAGWLHCLGEDDRLRLVKEGPFVCFIKHYG